MGVNLGLSRYKLRDFKKEEVTGYWRRRHKEDIHDLYSSPNFIPVIQGRRLRWVGKLMCGREKTCTQGISGGPCEHSNELSGSVKCGKFLE